VNQKENLMGTEPVPRLLVSMGLPIVLSMMLQAMYNIVDSMFVSRMPGTDGAARPLGELAVNALTLAFPVQMLFVAFGIGTGVGVGAMLSRQLGQKNREGVARTAGNGITLSLIMYVVFVLFGLFGMGPYLKSQTSDPVILEMATEYLGICTSLSIASIMWGIYEKLLQSTGKTKLSTAAQIIGALTNIVLDPIMIYGLIGFPQLGIAGAAIATVIGQFVTTLLAMYFQYAKNQEIPSGLRYLKLEGYTVKGIYSIGVSAIIMQALMSFMTYGVNIIFGRISASAVTAYGIFYKIQQFIYFAGFGIRDAITPLISYNYGRGSRKRIAEGEKWGMIDVTVIMVIGFVLMQLFAKQLAGIFGLSADTEQLCILAMCIISIGFIAAGINIAAQGIFQALESGTSSLIISLLRLLIVPLPLAMALSTLPGALDVVWWAFPAGEGVAAICAILLLARVNKRISAMFEKKEAASK
jgi:multidrug efflux pump